MDRTKKGIPTGVDRDVSEIEVGKRGGNGQGKRRQKRHTARGAGVDRDLGSRSRLTRQRAEGRVVESG